MSEYFASMSVTNSTMLCVGSITNKEAAAAQDDGIDISGDGYYLFLTEVGPPDTPIRLLAKIFSVAEAETLSRVLGRIPACLPSPA